MVRDRAHNRDMETTQATEETTTVAELTRAILAMESAASFREAQAKKLLDRAADLRSKVQAMRETIERIEDAELQAELDTHFTGEDESDRGVIA
jgi:histidine ammonia-lyase